VGSRHQEAIRRIDEANAEDPRGEALPYSERMTRWLDRIEPEASEALRIAVRAQHIRRWSVPRNEYPEGRVGYLKWRAALGEMHADITEGILRDVSYDDGTVEQVRKMLRKKKMKTDPEVQTLEDVACLVFLEHYLEDFAEKHDDAKIVDILRKTWRKMSERGREAALGIELPGRAKALVDEALAGEGRGG